MPAERSSTRIQPKPEQHIRILFHSKPYPHQPRNVNVLMEAEKAASKFNQKVAIGMTRLFSAMPTFWFITAWIVLWIVANATIVHFDPMPWPLLLCLASVPQLPLMIVIMVGQGLLGRQQELQAEEQFKTTITSYHDIEQIMEHLSSQDEELVKQTSMLIHLLKVSGIPFEQVVAVHEDGYPTNNGKEPGTGERTIKDQQAPDKA